MTKPEGKEVFPSQFGRYTLIERLATGGMAEVFRAKMLSTHGFEKLLVIKRILPHLAADKTFVSMFIDEAKLTAQLVHPKIVQVSDFGDVNGQFFIALEYVDGFDALALLRTSATRQVRLPIPICMFIAVEILDALDYAHNARDAEGRPMRLVHRDISPSNVFISRRGDIKLGDFGIAHAQERESKTQAGTLKGKYGYMSPEQVIGGSLDGRSDLFAVGIVLAEMIMGRRLFTAPNDLDVLLMVRDGRLDRLDKYCRDLQPDLDQMLRKALNKRVAERFQTAAEFRDTLAEMIFKMGFRIGPADVGKLASDYFDPSPEALVRLRDQAKRFRIRAPTAVYPAVSGKEPIPPAPRGGPGPPSQRFEWGLSSATPPPVPVERPQPPPLPDVELQIDVDTSDEPAAPAPTQDALVMEALHQALSQPLSIVDLDEYEAPSSGGADLLALPPQRELQHDEAHPEEIPDEVGDLSVLSAMRAFTDLAVAGQTAMLSIDLGYALKDLYLVQGAVESIVSDQSADQFGDYLVARGFLRAADLETATSQLPNYGGKLVEALVGLGKMRPIDIFRLQSQHVRERVLDLFTATEGTFSVYRGKRNPAEAFPLGLDSFEMIGAGVLTLSLNFLQARFGPMADFRPQASSQPRIAFETFRLGSKPRELWSLLDGRRTVRQLMTNFPAPADQLTFLRLLYLLIETDLARLE